MLNLFTFSDVILGEINGYFGVISLKCKKFQ